jgi:[ribosomal protein S5]-alanine N-acetyltransferase
MIKFDFSPFPEISTPRLLLRKLLPQDLEDLFALRSNSHVMAKLDKEPALLLEDAQQLLDKIDKGLELNNAITWAVCLREDNRLIGTLSFHNTYAEHHRAEVGFALLPAFHRRGLMQEGLSSVIYYGFSKMNLHTIEAKINPSNVASEKLLLKNGFVKEAHFKESYCFRGFFLDTAIFSLIKPDRIV